MAHPFEQSSNSYINEGDHFPGEMARLGGETSNTLADDLFETLEDWNTYLKLENIDLTDLPESLSEAQKEQAKPVAEARKQIRRPQP